MLGNFSFGDYFKGEAIPFAWELLTDGLAAAAGPAVPDDLQGRGAASRATTRRTRSGRSCVPAERIGELGAADNFWAMGDTGPVRPLLRDLLLPRQRRARATRSGRAVCRGVECSCDRYVEIWNNVFMEFDRQADGTLNPLPAPSIDTGMGLERVTAVIQGKLSNYDTDLFTPILDGDRRARGHAATARRWTTRATSRCASSPITCAR